MVGINALKKSGRYATATVSIAGSRVREQSSELRTVVRGKRHDIGLGGLKLKLGPWLRLGRPWTHEGHAELSGCPKLKLHEKKPRHAGAFN